MTISSSDDNFQPFCIIATVRTAKRGECRQIVLWIQGPRGFQTSNAARSKGPHKVNQQ